MKRMFIIMMILASSACMGQELITTKVVITNDSIISMCKTNGCPQTLIEAPEPGKSIIVQSISVANEAHARLYSPDSGTCDYQVGYLNGSYWYNLAIVPFDQLNSSGNTTIYYNVNNITNIYDEAQIGSAPLVIKSSKAMNFTAGYNQMSIYISYRIID